MERSVPNHNLLPIKIVCNYASAAAAVVGQGEGRGLSSSGVGTARRRRPVERSRSLHEEQQRRGRLGRRRRQLHRVIRFTQPLVVSQRRPSKPLS